MSDSNGNHEDRLPVRLETADRSTRILYLEPVTGGDDNGNTSPSGPVEYLCVVRSRLWLIAAMAVVGAAAATVLSLSEPPTYQARTTLELEGRWSPGGLTGESRADAGFTAEAYVPTQVKVLQSRTLRRRVSERLLREAKLSDYATPEWLGWIPEWVRPRLAQSSPAALPPVQVVARSADGSCILEVLCDAANPRLAADFANTMADEYIESNLSAMWQSAERTTLWLTRQLDAIRANLQKSENALQAYTREWGILFTGREGQETVVEQTLRNLQEELSKASADRIAKQSAYEIAHSGSAEAVPQVADNPRLTDYETKLAELRWELADLRTLFTPSHYKVRRMEAQIEDLEATLKRERSNTLNRIANDFQSARRREEMLAAAHSKQLQLVSENAKKAVYYGLLKRELESNQRLYEDLLQRVKQIGVRSALHASNIRVLDVAEPPANPYKPHMVRNAAMGALSGILLAAGLIMIMEFLNRSLRAPGEATFHLHVPELGVIPSQHSLPASEPRSRLQRLGSSLPGLNAPAECVELVTWQDRPSLLAESFRSTLASILASRTGEPRPGVIMVTSPGRREGKSSVVSNLGLALAEIHQDVLLIDADMRKPRLHEVFNLANTWGLSDLLREKAPLRDYPREALCRPTAMAGLSVLPAGPGTASIATLLYSTRMQELMQRLRLEFDVVLIDTPPMSYLFDARVLGRLADGAILVLRASHTTRDAALSAKQRLESDGIHILGTILNGWDLKSKTRYGYYTYPYQETGAAS